MDIKQAQETGYESVRLEYIGLLDPYATEGLAILRAEDGREFHMKAFSGEAAKQIAILDGAVEGSESLPSVYKLIGEICEENEIILVKVKIYESGDALRANLYFTGRKDIILRNYRASDAIALATFYKIPILIREKMLKGWANDLV